MPQLVAALVLLGAWIWFGFALVKLSGVGLGPEERWVAGPAAGLVAGPLGTYLLASLTGSLSWWVWTVVVVTCFLTGLLALRRPGSPLRPAPWFVLTAAALGGAVVWMNLYGVLAPLPGGGIAAVEHIWADTPFHTAISTSFALRDNYPPMHPIALGEPLAYPFLVDFASGALQRFGLGLRWSLVALNIPVQLLVPLGIGVISRRLSGRVVAGASAAVLFFALGNLGWLTIPSDIAEAGGVRAWLSDIPWSYTGDALGGRGRDRLGMGMYLGNPTFMYLLPRRAGAFGLAAGIGVLVLVEGLARRPRAGVALLLGVLMGALPWVHFHTAAAMALAAGIWGVAAVLRSEDRRATTALWAGAAVVAVVVSLPQVVRVLGHAQGFAAWNPGWTGEGREGPGSFLVFWLLNGGVLLLLGVVAAVRGPGPVRLWYLPFALMWVLANLVRTQPSEWDNTPWLVWWQAATCVLVAGLLAPLLETRRIGRVAAVAALASMLGGLLSFAYGAQHRQFLWSDAEVAAAREIGQRTPRDAVVLTAGSGFHGHPVNATAGRQVYTGWAGWLFTHGLDWAGYEQSLEAMLRGDARLMLQLGVDHVVVGPYEHAFARERGFELDETLPFDSLALVWEAELEGQHWTLYRFLAPVGGAP